MNDADVGRNDAKVVERLLAPFEELVTLAVAGELHLDVLRQRHLAAEVIDLDAVVDHQVDGDQRVDLRRVAADPRHRASHRGEVHHRRNAGEILQDDAIRFEGHFLLGDVGGVPRGQGPHVFLADGEVVAVPQNGFEQHTDRKRQRVDLAQPGVFQGGQAVDRRVAVAGVERVAGAERVLSGAGGAVRCCGHDGGNSGGKTFKQGKPQSLPAAGRGSVDRRGATADHGGFAGSGGLCRFGWIRRAAASELTQ